MDSNPIDAQSVKVHADPPVKSPSGQGERVKKVADTGQPAGGTELSIGQGVTFENATGSCFFIIMWSDVFECCTG